jgi:hypothetical protein
LGNQWIFFPVITRVVFAAVCATRAQKALTATRLAPELQMFLPRSREGRTIFRRAKRRLGVAVAELGVDLWNLKQF